MNERDRNREKQLERLFEASRDSLPGLEPDPGLPAHIRALAAGRAAGEARAARRGLGWLSLAGAAFALSIWVGGYIGYRVWATSQQAATEQMSDSDDVATAISQSGFADDLASDGEVGE